MKDKEKQIEEMAETVYENVYLEGHFPKSTSKAIARFIIEQGYRKIPKDSIVFSREDMKKYAKDCIAGEETGLDIINALIARAERYKEKAKQASKETAEKIYKLIDKKLELYQNGVIGGSLYDSGYQTAIYDIKRIIKEQLGVEIKE